MKKDHGKGFTLLELMVVVAIIAIVIAIAWPNYIQWYKRTQVDNDAAIITSNLELAKISAIKNSALVEMTVDTGGKVTLKSNPGTNSEQTFKTIQLNYLLAVSQGAVTFNTRGIPVTKNGGGQYIYITDNITFNLKNINGDENKSITINVAGNIHINN